MVHHLRLETRQPFKNASHKNQDLSCCCCSRNSLNEIAPVSHSCAIARRLTLASQRLYPTNVPLYSATEAEYRGYCSRARGQSWRRRDGGHVCEVGLKCHRVWSKAQESSVTVSGVRLECHHEESSLSSSVSKHDTNQTLNT